MKKLIPVLIILCLVISCAKDYEQIAADQVKDYVVTLDRQDLAGQLKVLEQFELNGPYYKEHFLSYVDSAELITVDNAYEDDYIIIMRGEFFLRFKDDYPGSNRLSAGDNKVIRYFTFYKLEDMALKEILDKLIK